MKVKRNNRTKQPSARNGGIRILRVKKGDSLKTIYAKYRKSFTAADLQKYTEIEPMIPFDQIMAELETIHLEEMKKKRKKSKR
jgi:hypothetical protein